MYDVIIIGGGITGAGIARDCARRGLSVLLLEKRDFAAGTTGTCSGMLHGGIRYLIDDPQVTRLSCQESGIVQRLAPHLIRRMPWLMPAFPGDHLGLLDTFMAQYDLLAPLKNSSPHVLLTAAEARRLEPALAPDVIGGVTWDEPAVDPFRLTLLNVLAAQELGATCLNHARVTGIIRQGARVVGVRWVDTISGAPAEARARCVVNAAGPWTPWVAELAGIPFRLKPTRGTHLILDRRITSVAVHAGGVEVMPHENTSLLGLTDVFFFENPDQVRPTPEEVEYLLSSMERGLPGIRRARVLRAMSGVRPLIDQPGDKERKLTREHRVYDHAELDGVEGFVTIAGGKLVIYRHMAEDVTNLVCAKLGVEAPCRTAHEPLPGGEYTPDPQELAREFEMPLHTTERLVHRHGARARDVLALTQEHPAWKSHLCVCEPVTEAEVRYAARHEGARTLDDLRRRVRLGVGPCQGTICTARAAAVLAEELGEGPAYARWLMVDFLQERWKGQRSALRGAQLRQVEITRSLYALLELGARSSGLKGQSPFQGLDFQPAGLGSFSPNVYVRA